MHVYGVVDYLELVVAVAQLAVDAARWMWLEIYYNNIQSLYLNNLKTLNALALLSHSSQGGSIPLGQVQCCFMVSFRSTLTSCTYI